ncbi:MAG TPA: FkbM family methyltransferase [Chryseosolibacter sp.]
MKRWLKLLKIYPLKDFVTLVFATAVDAIFSKIPKQTFTIKNTFDALVARNADFVWHQTEVMVTLNKVKFYLRTQGSDFRVFNQIVLDGGMTRAIEMLRSLNIDKPKVMDCGSNIGLCTLLLKSAFPDADIIAIEPDTKNFNQLKKNVQTNGFENVKLVNAGVWYEASSLAVRSDFGDGSDWAVALEKSPNESLNTVPVRTPEQIAVEHNWDRIDYLKIDIEGSEFSLLERVENWRAIFNTVKLISIEPHAEAGDVIALIDILNRSGFSLQLYQELIIGIRK